MRRGTRPGPHHQVAKLSRRAVFARLRICAPGPRRIRSDSARDSPTAAATSSQSRWMIATWSWTMSRALVGADVRWTWRPTNREARAELEEGVTAPADQGRLEVALGDSPREPQEVEHVRVLGNLASQLGVLAGQSEFEVGRGGTCSRVRSSLDLVQEHVA